MVSRVRVRLLLLLAFSVVVTMMSENRAVLKIVSHHKTGTFAGLGLINNMCCPPNFPLTEYIWHLFDKCSKFCPHVEFNGNGNRNWMVNNHVYYLHFIRHPIDVLLSGYEYHKACNEPEWTNTTRTVGSKFYPEKFPVQGSYCQFLQSVNATEGLRMEAKRTIYAMDGIGRMIHDFKAFQRISGFSLVNRNANYNGALQVCLDDIQGKSAAAVADFIQPWNRYNRTLQIADSEYHRTSKSKKKEHYHEAIQVLLEYIPAHALITFPCTTELFDEDSEEWKKLLKFL